MLFVIVALLIDNEIDCFKPTQTLIGYMSTRAYVLTVEPRSNLSSICCSFSVGSASATLYFQSLSIHPISASIIANMSQYKLQFVFDFNDPQTF